MTTDAMPRNQTIQPLLVGAFAATATIGLAMVLLWASALSPDLPALVPASTARAWQAPTPLPPKQPKQPLRAMPAAAANPYIYSDVAERAVKSVVSITTSKLVKHSSRRGFDHPMFGPFGRRRPQARGSQQLRRGAGSGVIVRADGIVLTNNHVIAGSDKIRVELADQRAFDAEIIGSDPKTDLAVLRLKGKVGAVSTLPLADSDKTRLGEVVLAIGNSFGRLNHTVTMGIVSAKGRGNVGIVDYEDFIQTDAAINPGNSGGALVNMRGELIGINTAIASRSGGSQGVGFAIPANMARTVMTSILDHGEVNRGWLGVVIQEMSDEMMRAFGVSQRGVLIGDVAAASPAAKAGLKRGDVVLAINGKRVQRTSRLRNMVALAGAGSTVTMNITRRGKRSQLSVKLGRAPGQRAAKRALRRSADERIGMTLQPLDAELRRRYSVGKDIRDAVIVTEVTAGSIAAAAGLRAGDVLLEVGRAPFKSIDQAVKRIEQATGTLLLTVRRGRHNMYALLRLN